VIIIGSGAGGGTLANHLTPSGKSILILERGDWLKREALNWDRRRFSWRTGTSPKRPGSTAMGSSLADLNYRAGHRQEAIKGYLDLLPVTQRLAAIKPLALVTEMRQPMLENSVAIELLPTDPPQAMEHINHGIALERDLISQYPDDKSLRQGLGSLMAAGAGGYRLMEDLEKSGQYYLESIEAREELLHNDPDNSVIRRNLMIAYGNYAALQCPPRNAFELADNQVELIRILFGRRSDDHPRLLQVAVLENVAFAS
jgi:hypothetical protein